MSNLAEAEFLTDVGAHQMRIIKEDGTHRHIRFQKPGTMCMHFDLITWPGYLCYTGDMGTFVFSRLNDMFEFFRTDREYAQQQGKQLGINRSYWAEKLQAVDGNRHVTGATEFDEVAFKRVINEYRVRWMREAKAEGLLDKEQRRELWEDAEHRVLDELDNGGQMAMHAAYGYTWSPSNSNYQWDFGDFFDNNFQKYTRTFEWCCYALAWGIQQYDEAMEKEAA